MFVQINGVILDKKEHERKILLLKRLLKYELYDSMRKYGFEKRKKGLFHRETGLSVRISFKEDKGIVL